MKTSKFDAEVLTASDLQRLAVNLLARREHSRLEILQKLSTKCDDIALVESVLDQLVAMGWQSDERYCSVFLRSRLHRGPGPLRLRQELKAKGICDHLIAAAFVEQDMDWFECARTVALKKMLSLRNDPKWREKLYRFLTYRGFDSEQTRYALEALQDGDHSDS